MTEKFEPVIEEPVQGEFQVNNEADQELIDNDYQDYEVEELLNFKLTEEELAQTAISIQGIYEEIADLKSELKDFTKVKKDEIKDKESAIASYMKKIEKGEDRQIPCTKRVYFSKGIVEFINPITKEVISERKIESEDRQMRLNVTVSEDAFANESDAIDAGMKKKPKINYEENHKKAKEAEEDALIDDGEELEPITNRTLVENDCAF